MTNEEKIKQLSGIDLIKKIREIGMHPIYKHIDWEKWLASEDAHYPVIGQKAYHKANQCYVVAEHELFGEQYCSIVVGNLIMQVPKHEVRFL